MMYKIFAIASLICILSGIARKPRKLKLKNFNKQFRKNAVLTTFDKIICRNNNLNHRKEKLISKLQLVNLKSYEYNNEFILKYVAIDVCISISMLIALFNVITMWYTVITISAVYFYTMLLLGISYIEYKINKIHRQFPEALQSFLDEYIIHKNIKSAISNSYSKMPNAIGGAFELLARSLSGEKDYESAIKKFANELSYIWGHSFAEILIMSYEGAGDITEELMTLNKLVSEEITTEEEEKSSRFENKITFIIIYSVALAGIIINILTNRLAKYLYFYTSTGNALIAAWLIILIIRITVIPLFERGR